MNRLWRSAPLAKPPLVVLGALGLVLWLAPVALALLVIPPLQLVAETSFLAGAVLFLLVVASGLMLSPVFSWLGWLIALPCVWWLLRHGWFGWGSAAALGFASGAVAGAFVASEIAAPFGLVALLALRALLGRLEPAMHAGAV